MKGMADEKSLGRWYGIFMNIEAKAFSGAEEVVGY
jgi:hypothetical protein